MTLLQLSYYMEVCRSGNFTRAAEKLHVTQPTTTTAVRELEAEFGVTLFERTTKKLEMTEAGKALYDMGIKMLSYNEYIHTVMDDYANEKHRIVMGMGNMTNAAEFPGLYQVIHREHPDIEIETINDITLHTVPMLDKGKIHLLLTVYPMDPARYRSMLWNYNRMMFCVSAKNPLAGKNEVSISEICREPLISFFGDNYLKTLGITEVYAKTGSEIHINYRCSQINTMIDLIRRQEGCGFMPEHAIPADGTVVGIPIREWPKYTPVYLAWTKETERYQVVKRVVDCVRKYREQNPPYCGEKT